MEQIKSREAMIDQLVDALDGADFTLAPRSSFEELYDTAIAPMLERASLEGHYTALEWVLHSPAIPDHVAAQIEHRGLSLIPRLRELGAAFDDGEGS